MGPLRSILERETIPDAVREFCSNRDDHALVEDLIRRVTWDCGCPQTANLRQELERRLAQVLREKFAAPSQEAPQVAAILAYRVLQRSAMAEAEERELSRSELHQLVEFATRVNIPQAGFELLLRLAAANMPNPGPRQPIVAAQGTRIRVGWSMFLPCLHSRPWCLGPLSKPPLNPRSMRQASASSSVPRGSESQWSLEWLRPLIPMAPA